MKKPRAYTAEEGKDLFLNQVTALYNYWHDLPTDQVASRRAGETELDARMSGFLFSLFVLFDGGSGFMPAFDIFPSPHPEDKDYHIGEGENYWDPEVSVNAHTSLHETFDWNRLHSGRS